MNIFNVDYGLLAKRLLPPNKRLDKQKAWLRSLMAPLDDLNTSYWLTYYPDLLVRAKRNAQKIVFENTLNEEFNQGGSNPIYIVNSGNILSNTFFFNEDEGYPAVYMYNESEGIPVYLYNSLEFENEFSFTIYVPTDVFSTYNEDQITAEADKYAIAGTTFNIIQY